MKVFLILLTLSMATAFAPPRRKLSSPIRTKALDMERRDLFLLGVSASVVVATPPIAQAKPASTWFFDKKIEQVFEPSQMPTDGRLDLNTAFVVSIRHIEESHSENVA